MDEQKTIYTIRSEGEEAVWKLIRKLVEQAESEVGRPSHERRVGLDSLAQLVAAIRGVPISRDAK